MGDAKPSHRSNKELIPIYTDWANHYLEKCGRARLISDLQRDCQDSLLLRDVVESVTGHNVPDFNDKPRTHAQTVENIGGCLKAVAKLGVNVEVVKAKEIADGQLKAILGLFFSLSRYKQAQKQQAATLGQPKPASNKSTPAKSMSKIASPFKSGSGTGIPTPGSSAHSSPARTPNRKVSDSKPSVVGSSGLRAPSRSPSVSKLPGSGIPAPGSATAKAIKPPACATRAGSQAKTAPKQPTAAAAGSTQSSSPKDAKMLDKFKLFSGKDKTAAAAAASKPPTPKAASSAASSSGVSSAKSDVTSSSEASSSLRPAASGLKPPSAAAPSNTTPNRNPLRSLSKRAGLKSPKNTRIAKVSTPEIGTSADTQTDNARKVSGCAQTSPQLSDRDNKEQKAAVDEDTDADSAYAGGGSTSISPTSSNAPSEASRLSERRSPVGASSPPPPASSAEPKSPSFTSPKSGLRKPTLAVKGIMTSTSTGANKPKADAQHQPNEPQLASPTIGVVSPMTQPQPQAEAAKPISQEHSSANTSADSIKLAPPGIKKPASRMETTFGCATDDVKTQCASSEGATADDAVKPMQPLVPRTPQHFQVYNTRVLAEKVRCAAGEGYVSDGDALGTAIQELTRADLNAGYMSEGGISMYARKMQARFKEGLEAVRDSSLHRPVDHFDSFEDSSSVSSGVSGEHLDLSTDDLTGSSLSDTQYLQAMQPQVGRRPLNSASQSRVLQQRKMHEQGNIDQLLQKCRSSSRGQQSGRPKSEQMNNGQPQPMHVAQNGHYETFMGNSNKAQPLAQLSADGDTLRVHQPSVPSSFGTPTLGPRSRTALHILRAQSMQPQQQQPPQSYMNGQQMDYPAGYHSLDRKRHLLGYYSENEYQQYMTMPSNGVHNAAMALVSPRRVPALHRHDRDTTSLSNDAHIRWTHNPNAAQQPRQQSNMSRSMHYNEQVRQQQQQGGKRGSSQLKVSPTSVDVDTPGSRQQQQQWAGHSRNTEGIYANLIQRTSTASMTAADPQHQMQRSANGGATSPSASAPVARTAPMQAHHSPYLAGVLNRVGADAVVPNAANGIHDSQLSLASNSSSIYNNQEEKYQAEIRKLHAEIEAYRQKVSCLTTQQSNYSSIVQAFEKALQQMQKRVESLQAQASQKEGQRSSSEMHDIQGQMSDLRCLSAQAGIKLDARAGTSSPSVSRRHTLAEGQQQQQHTPSPPNSEKSAASGGKHNGLTRQPSCESMMSTVSQRSSKSSSSKGSKDTNSINGQAAFKNKRSWTPNVDTKQIRSSLTKAFKNKKKGSSSDAEDAYDVLNPKLESIAGSGNRLNEEEETMVVQLRQQLVEQESTLTDCRLEALTSAHQLDHMKEQLVRLRAENAALKHTNEQLAKLALRDARSNSHSSLPQLTETELEANAPDGFLSERAYSLKQPLNDCSSRRRVPVYVNRCTEGRAHLIGTLCLTAATDWHSLDQMLCHLFNDYVHKLDGVASLNLSAAECIDGYECAGVLRSLHCNAPPANAPLHCTSQQQQQQQHSAGIRVSLKRMDALAFDCLVPKTLLQRWVMQLQEQRRLCLYGGSGSGKRSLGSQLANFVCDGVPQSHCTRLTCAVDSCDQLRDQIQQAVNRCNRDDQRRVYVLMLNELQHVEPVFDRVLEPLQHLQRAQQLYVIATVDQAVANTELQIKYGFRCMLWDHSCEPVKAYVGRVLRRRLAEHECTRTAGCSSTTQDTHRVIEFMPKLLAHLNKFLDSWCGTGYLSAEWFTACPLDADQSRAWFIQLWNGRVIPHLLSTMQTSARPAAGQRASVLDPTDFVCEQWPWTEGELADTVLQRLTPAHANPHYNAKATDANFDPLLVLMKLQEEKQLCA